MQLVRISVFSFLVTVLLLGAGLSHARWQPVYDIVNKPIVTSTGRQLSIEEVGRILQESASLKGWQVALVEEGYLKAQIDVRKHHAAIDIRYTNAAYSITYRDSKVLGYDGTKIHRNYNKWIKHIEQLVDQRLATL